MGESIKRIVGPYQDSYSPNGIIGEKDACGVGFIANFKGIESNWILKQSLKGLNCMEHRGGCGGDSDAGDFVFLVRRFLSEPINCEMVGIYYILKKN